MHGCMDGAMSTVGASMQKKSLKRNNSSVLLKLLSDFMSRTYSLTQPPTCYCTCSAFRTAMILQMALSEDCLHGVSFSVGLVAQFHFSKDWISLKRLLEREKGCSFLCNADWLLDNKHKAVCAICCPALCLCSHVLIQFCLVYILFCK